MSKKIVKMVYLVVGAIVPVALFWTRGIEAVVGAFAGYVLGTSLIYLLSEWANGQ